MADMDADAVAGDLRHLAGIESVQGCALVELESGMVWLSSGTIPGLEHIAENAVEFWRLYLRLARPLDQLGSLRMTTLLFEQSFLTLTAFSAFSPPLLLVCVSQRNVDWARWGQGVDKLKRVLGETGVLVREPATVNDK
jgi:hypothetical protein